jgi:hypothetical protein
MLNGMAIRSPTTEVSTMAHGPGERRVGVRSALQYGPLVTRDHRKLAQALASVIQSHEGR